jgi:hypothetical protein
MACPIFASIEPFRPTFDPDPIVLSLEVATEVPAELSLIDVLKEAAWLIEAKDLFGIDLLPRINWSL